MRELEESLAESELEEEGEQEEESGERGGRGRASQIVSELEARGQRERDGERSERARHRGRGGHGSRPSGWHARMGPSAVHPVVTGTPWTDCALQPWTRCSPSRSAIARVRYLSLSLSDLNGYTVYTNTAARPSPNRTSAHKHNGQTHNGQRTRTSHVPRLEQIGV